MVAAEIHELRNCEYNTLTQKRFLPPATGHRGHYIYSKPVVFVFRFVLLLLLTLFVLDVPNTSVLYLPILLGLV